MVGRPPSAARAAEMRRVLSDLDRSDLSLKAFCERRGISRSLLIYWRKRLAATDQTKPIAADRAAAFLPVHVLTPREHSNWIVEFPSGARIHVPIGFDVEELGRLLREVRTC